MSLFIYPQTARSIRLQHQNNYHPNYLVSYYSSYLYLQDLITTANLCNSQLNVIGELFAGKLQYVGRSGLPGIPRYTAHDRCLNAEEFTQSIIDNYSHLDEMTKMQHGEHPVLPSPTSLPASPSILTSATLSQIMCYHVIWYSN